MFSVIRYNKETKEIDDSVVINSKSPLKSGYKETDEKYVIVEEVLLEAVEYEIDLDIDLDKLSVNASMKVVK